MESLLFMIDAFAMVVVVFFSLKNDTRRAGDGQIGIFRITESIVPSVEAKADPVLRGRVPPRR